MMNLKRGLVVVSLLAVSLPVVAADIDKINQLTQDDFHKLSQDLGAALSYKPLTPTAGIGKVWASSTPNGIPALSNESLSLNKVFVGANLNFGLMNLAFEGDRTGEATSYGAKLGFRF